MFFSYSSSSLSKVRVSHRDLHLLGANWKKSPISITIDNPPKIVIGSDIILFTLCNCLSIDVSRLRSTMLISSIIREDWYNYRGFALVWWPFPLQLVTPTIVCTILPPIPFAMELIGADMINSRFFTKQNKVYFNCFDNHDLSYITFSFYVY